MADFDYTIDNGPVLQVQLVDEAGNATYDATLTGKGE